MSYIVLSGNAFAVAALKLLQYKKAEYDGKRASANSFVERQDGILEGERKTIETSDTKLAKISNEMKDIKDEIKALEKKHADKREEYNNLFQETVEPRQKLPPMKRTRAKRRILPTTLAKSHKHAV